MSKNGRISIEVNLSDTFDEFLMSKEQAEAMTEKALSDIADAFVFNWKAAAKQALGSTRSQYIKGIQQVDRGRLEKAVILVGILPNMLEFGASPFDMKAGFEKSLKRKIKTNGGWYLTIPFRIGAAGSLGENEAFSGVMPDEISKIAKGLTASGTDASGAKKSGNSIKLSDIPQSLQATKTRPAVGGFEAYEHKNNIYEGITRSEKTYEGATQNSYTSFRRVSDKSSAMAWINSGIKAYDLANRALLTTDIDTIADNSVDEFLSNL